MRVLLPSFLPILTALVFLRSSSISSVLNKDGRRKEHPIHDHNHHRTQRNLTMMITTRPSFVEIGSRRLFSSRVQTMNEQWKKMMDVGGRGSGSSRTRRMAAGAAAAFSYTRKSILNSIAGVAIAVALLPPLAVTGIGLAYGIMEYSETGLSLAELGAHTGSIGIAEGSFLLFLINLIGIILVS